MKDYYCGYYSCDGKSCGQCTICLQSELKDKHASERRILLVLAEALRRTGKQFRYCGPTVEHWMPALAANIEVMLNNEVKES